MSQKILTASSNTGVGLWTTICLGVCGILGRESKSFKKKQSKVLKAANKDLEAELHALGPKFSLVDYRVTWSGKLAVCVSALAVSGQANNELIESDGASSEANKKNCPKCGAPIDEEMLFCGECGAKLK